VALFLQELDRKMTRKSIKIAIGSIILITAGVAIFLSMSAFVNPYVTVTELLQNPMANRNKTIQLVGIVANGSLNYSDGNTRFILQDIEQPNDTIQIIYHDIPPTGLLENQKIVAIGQLNSDMGFEAQKFLLQCPSKYES